MNTVNKHERKKYGDNKEKKTINNNKQKVGL